MLVHRQTINLCLEITKRFLVRFFLLMSGEKDTDSVFTAFLIIEDHNLLPFGIDPFGNYICYSVKNGQILFWDHETGETKEIKNS